MKDAPSWPASAALAWARALWRSPAGTGRAHGAWAAEVRRAQQWWQELPEAEMPTAVARLRAGLAVEGFTDRQMARAMGLVCLHLHRQRGWTVHDVQLAAARWMLGNRLIEMATGEGKTLTVVLAASVAALAGVPVHVMTSNDYLARRDAAQWAPLYQAMGLTVASVEASSGGDERRQAYRHDVVYVTAKEVAFDHLRDRAARVQGHDGAGDGTVLRGLCMAIVDEADSILIDEACTPLVLSQTVSARQADQQQRLAVFLARQLHAGRDFLCHDQQLSWLPAGRDRLAELSAHLQGPWRLERYREEQVSLALTALHLLLRDVHYLLRDDTVHIIDGPTGRLALGRAWSRGLHQMVCIKEGLQSTPHTETLTQTTYQELFPRYHRLCGLSGTLWEERRELLAVYGLPVVRVPLRRPSQRDDQGLVLVPTVPDKWQRVASTAARMAAAGRAVLIGTNSVADSEALSAVLSRQAVAHRVLNARQDGQAGDEEREIIEQAGREGAVTVATHMAGRGTDIQLAPAVLSRGGLHVINTHLNVSARIDRQLSGRAGRQGQPGSHERVLSWQDEALGPWSPARRWVGLGGAWVAGLLCQWVQHRESRRAFWRRWQLLQLQLAMQRQLAWAGRDEWD